MLNRAIGVIDSGVGGLTVAKELIRQSAERAYYIFRRHSEMSVWPALA